MNPRWMVSTFFVLAFAGAYQAQMAFDGAVNYPVGEKPEGGTLFDFNRDGELDLVVTTEGPDRIEFLANDGLGTFAASFALATGNDTSPEGVVDGDFDADGDLDLLPRARLISLALSAPECPRLNPLSSGARAGWLPMRPPRARARRPSRAARRP